MCMYHFDAYWHHEYAMVIQKGGLFRKISFLWDKSSPDWTQLTSVTYIFYFGEPKGVQNMESSVNSEYIGKLLVFWDNLCKVPQGVKMDSSNNDGVGWTYLVITFVIITVEKQMDTQNKAEMFLWLLNTNMVAHIPLQKVYMHHTCVMVIPQRPSSGKWLLPTGGRNHNVSLYIPTKPFFLKPKYIPNMRYNSNIENIRMHLLFWSSVHKVPRCVRMYSWKISYGVW